MINHTYKSESMILDLSKSQSTFTSFYIIFTVHINFIITKHTCSTEVKVRDSLTTHWYWLVLIIIMSDTPILVHTYFQMLVLIICPCLMHIVIIELSSMYCRVHIIYVMKSWIDKTSDKILTSDWFWSEDDLSLTVSLCVTESVCAKIPFYPLAFFDPGCPRFWILLETVEGFSGNLLTSCEAKILTENYDKTRISKATTNSAIQNNGQQNTQNTSEYRYTGNLRDFPEITEGAICGKTVQKHDFLAYFEFIFMPNAHKCVSICIYSNYKA